MSLPPSEIPLGAIRFNSDSQKLEYWNGEAWFQVKTFSPTLEGGARGVFSGGDPSRDTNMDYITIATRGNGTDFGDFPISNGTGNRGIIGSNTRGFCNGGESPSAGDSHNVIGKWEFTSTGSAIDFANLTFTSKGGPGLSNATRAVQARGYGAPSITHEDVCFFTMASQQDAVDFGDLISGSSYGGSGIASPTRGVIITARSASVNFVNNIEYVTIATTGSFADFGDVTNIDNSDFTATAGNSTRGVLAGGQDSPNTQTEISYVTYATTGNTIKFGDLHTANSYAAAVSDSITMITGGGQGATNRMDAINIATGGTSVDSGDLTVSKTTMTGSSNGHGGLG